MKSPAVFFLILFFSTLFVAGAGLSSQLSLGDEVYHYHFAKDSLRLGERALTHSLYPTMSASTVHYVTDPGWPLALAWLWKISDGISFPLAQIYHSLFYILLGISVYAAGCRLYGGTAAIWAGLLALSVPMLVSFGILFYTDLPATALMCASFALFDRRRMLAAGAVIALAFLVKKTAALFLPAALILILYRSWKNWRFLPWQLFAYFTPPAAVILHEQLWNAKNFSEISLPILADRLHTIYLKNGVLSGFTQLFSTGEFSNSVFYNPIDVLKYFGVTVGGGLLIYFLKKNFEKKDVALWLLAGSYMAAIIFLRLIPDLRYLMPIAPFLCLFAGKAFSKISSKWVVCLALSLCMLQILSASIYTKIQRRVPASVMEGFEWLQKNTPPTALIMYPEPTLLEYAKRPMVWGLFKTRTLFWGTMQEQEEEISRVGLDYIAILKSRIYDDTLARHTGGYPQSFVKKIEEWPLANRVYENEKMDIWKIKQGS